MEPNHKINLCGWCDKPFEGHSNKLYCSHSCRQLSYAERKHSDSINAVHSQNASSNNNPQLINENENIDKVEGNLFHLNENIQYPPIKNWDDIQKTLMQQQVINQKLLSQLSELTLIVNSNLIHPTIDKSNEANPIPINGIDSVNNASLPFNIENQNSKFLLNVDDYVDNSGLIYIQHELSFDKNQDYFETLKLFVKTLIRLSYKRTVPTEYIRQLNQYMQKDGMALNIFLEISERKNLIVLREIFSELRSKIEQILNQTNKNAKCTEFYISRKRKIQLVSILMAIPDTTNYVPFVFKPIKKTSGDEPEHENRFSRNRYKYKHKEPKESEESKQNFLDKISERVIEVFAKKIDH